MCFVWLVRDAAILEMNKRTMKTDNIRKTNYVTKVYKNQDCPGSVVDAFFFLHVPKKNTIGAFF